MKMSGDTPRKQIYVNRVIQGRMLRRFAVMWLVYHVVLWNAMFLYRYLQYRGELLAGAAPVPFAELYSQFFMQHYSVLVCAAAVLPVLLWDMVRMTHRVAGPLVRFQRALSELAEGRPVERVQIRQGDLLLEFQNEFNAFLEKIGMVKRPGKPGTATGGASPSAPGSGARSAGEAQSTVVSELRDLQETVTQAVEPARTPAARSGA